jgi:hypothetical protein
VCIRLYGCACPDVFDVWLCRLALAEATWRWLGGASSLMKPRREGGRKKRQEHPRAFDGRQLCGEWGGSERLESVLRSVQSFIYGWREIDESETMDVQSAAVDARRVRHSHGPTADGRRSKAWVVQGDATRGTAAGGA